jgi:predicted nucleotidyltransferase
MLKTLYIELSYSTGIWKKHKEEENRRNKMARIIIDREKISDFCRRHHIRKLALFGSVLREDFGPESDVDVLVEFEQGHVPGLAFFSMERELAEILNHKVDLNTPQFLSPYFRDRVLAEAEAQYVAA